MVGSKVKRPAPARKLGHGNVLAFVHGGSVHCHVAYFIDMFVVVVAGSFDHIAAVEKQGSVVAGRTQGGAAAAAYGRVQLEDITEVTRGAWRDALLKYCELDTLAMAMVVQGWRAWLKSNS